MGCSGREMETTIWVSFRLDFEYTIISKGEFYKKNSWWENHVYELFFSFWALFRSNTWCWLAQQCVICNELHWHYDTCLQDWRQPPYKNFCWTPGLFAWPCFEVLCFALIRWHWDYTFVRERRVHALLYWLNGKNG